MKKTLCAVFFAATVLLASSPQKAQGLPPGGTAVSPDIAAAFSRAGVQVLKERVPLFDFSLPLLSGKTQSLSGLNGKVVFLNFWATWCPPCRQEMPSMEKLYQRFRNEGLEFLAVDIQENKKEVEAFMKKYSLNFPVALDSSAEAAVMYGVRGIPATYIIDRDGAIIAAVVGGRQWDSPEMVNAFGLLLNNGR
jgi:thiol-disulfide isomerase/thioredoxin